MIAVKYYILQMCINSFPEELVRLEYPQSIRSFSLSYQSHKSNTEIHLKLYMIEYKEMVKFTVKLILQYKQFKVLKIFQLNSLSIFRTFGMVIRF